MPKRPKHDPADDEPKIGDIWRLEEYYIHAWQHYLLVKQLDKHTFTMLCLNTGHTRDIYFNFELDDWRFVA